MTGQPTDPNIGPVRRISVIGPSGSGKTFLARELAGRLGLPHFELDAVRWDAGRERPPAEFVELVGELAGGDAWIIDGHYRDVRHLVWRRADMVVWLNLPLPVVALRLFGRFRRKRQPADRTDIASPRPIAPNSASWGRRLGRLARTLRERHEYRRLLRAPEYGALAVTELTSARGASEWLAQFAAADPGTPDVRPLQATA